MDDKIMKFRLCGNLQTSISGKLLYFILTEISDKNEIAIPQRKISQALQISKSTVSKNLRKLKKSGYIEIIEQYNDYGGRAPNKYIIK